MAIGHSQGVLNQALQLQDDLARTDQWLKETQGQGIYNEKQTLQELNEKVQQAKTSYANIVQLFEGDSAVDDAVDPIVFEMIGKINEDLDSLEQSRWNLEKSVEVIVFNDSLKDIYQTFSATKKPHDLDQIKDLETTMRPHFCAAYCKAISAEQVKEVQGSISEMIEEKYVTYFTEKFEGICSELNGSPQADFNRLLPMLGELAHFRQTHHSFVSPEKNEVIQHLIGKVTDILHQQVGLQDNAEKQDASYADDKTKLLTAIESKDEKSLKQLFQGMDPKMRNSFYAEINPMLKRPIPPGGQGRINQGQWAITDYASADACKKVIEKVFVSQVEHVSEGMKQELSAVLLSIDQSSANGTSIEEEPTSSIKEEKKAESDPLNGEVTEEFEEVDPNVNPELWSDCDVSLFSDVEDSY